MEDLNHELEIKELKYEKNIIDQTNEDRSSRTEYKINKSEIETPFTEYVEEVNICEQDIYILPDSPPKRIHLEGINSLDIGKKSLTLEVKADDNNRTFDNECDDCNSRTTKFTSSVDTLQTNLCKNQKYDSTMLSPRKSEFDNTICESSELDSKGIEDICEDDRMSKSLPSPVEVRSPSPLVSVDKNLKQANDECFDENYKSEYTSSKSEHMQTKIGTLTFESSAEDVDACFTEFIQKLTPKLILLCAFRDIETGSENKWQQCPAERNTNINILESTSSNMEQTDLSKASGSKTHGQVSNNVCSGRNYKNESAAPNPELFQAQGISNFQSTDKEFGKSFIKFLKHLKPQFIDWFERKKRECSSEKVCQTCPQEMNPNINVAGSEDAKIEESNLSYATKSDTADDAKRECIFNRKDRQHMFKILHLLEELDNDQKEQEVERVLDTLYKRTPQIIARARALKAAEINSQKAKIEEKKETLKQKSLEIKRKNVTQCIEISKNKHLYENEGALNTANRFEGYAFECNSKLGKNNALLNHELECLLQDLQVADLEKDRRTRNLTEETLLERKSKTFQTQSSASPAISKKKTDCEKSVMGTGARPKNKAIPSKIITGATEKKEYLSKSMCKVYTEAFLREVFLKSGNWTAAHDVEETETKSLESNPINTGLTDALGVEDEIITEVNDVKYPKGSEFMFEHFSELIEELKNKILELEERCKEFLSKLKPLLDTNIPKNIYYLLKKQINNCKSVNDKSVAASEDLVHLFFLLHKFPTLHLAAKPDLKEKNRENLHRIYTTHSTLYLCFEDIKQNLMVLDGGIDMQGFQKTRLRRVVAEFVELIEKMKKTIFENKETINCLYEAFIRS